MVDDLDIDVQFQAFLERTNIFCFYSFFWEIVPQFYSSTTTEECL